MIAQIIVNDKSFGDKVLYEGLELNIEEGEKLGLIGRNGTGKTTLLGIVTGDDKDFDGEVNFKREQSSLQVVRNTTATKIKQFWNTLLVTCRNLFG